MNRDGAHPWEEDHDPIDSNNTRLNAGVDLQLQSRPMNAPELLEHAADVVARRRREYGEPAILFQRVAQRWSLTLGTRVSPEQVVLCLVDLKVERLAHDPRHLDSIADVAGYAGCLAEVQSDA